MSVKIQRTVKLLLVEDSPSDVRLTREALRDSTVPVELSVVTDGEAALSYLYHREPYTVATRPDLILLDFKLPKKNGREVLEVIKQDPDLHLIPVLVLTTANNYQDVMMAYRLHANSYIQKPIDLHKFLQVMRAIENFWLHLAVFPPVAAEADAH